MQFSGRTANVRARRTACVSSFPFGRVASRITILGIGRVSARRIGGALELDRTFDYGNSHRLLFRRLAETGRHSLPVTEDESLAFLWVERRGGG